MRAASRSRVLAGSQQQIFDLIADPEHMPRWWPGVTRMEGVAADRFTQVLATRRGNRVRADFRVLQSDPPWSRSWTQELRGTPFARVLRESTVEVALEPAGGGTLVTIVQRQRLRGYSWTGGLMVRRATANRLTEALDGLERICG